MTANRNSVIVEDSLCIDCTVPTKQVHHRDFPEIRAEGSSVAEGAALLADRLSHAREGIESQWRREGIEQAINDVAAFLGSLEEGDQPSEASCRCEARAPGQCESMRSGTTPSR